MNKKFGAFQNWKVLLCVEQGKSGSFTRMLEAGGAKVLGTVPPFQNIVHVTHAFISKLNIHEKFFSGGGISFINRFTKIA